MGAWMLVSPWYVAGLPSEVSRGLSALYADLLQPKPAVRLDFLKTLVRRADAVCNRHARTKDFDLRYGCMSHHLDVHEGHAVGINER